MYASEEGFEAILVLLLDHGADKDMKKHEEETAMSLALNEKINDMLEQRIPVVFVLK